MVCFHMTIPHEQNEVLTDVVYQFSVHMSAQNPDLSPIQHHEDEL